MRSPATTARFCSPFALPLALAALLVLGVLLALGLRPPAARSVIAPLDEFSAARALNILEHLLAEGVPHPVGSPANFVVRDRIISHLEASGYEVQVQQAFSCRAQGGMCAPVENILARLRGTGGAPRALMLTSHYDSRGAGPGASDAGSSVAAILEIARILRSDAPLRNDVIVHISDGEEAGLLGAEAFVAEHEWAADVALVVNLEARGTSGPSIMFETSDDNHWLVREFASAVKRPVASSLTFEVYRMLPNDTDMTVYRRSGMAAINFAFIGNLAHYHSARDDIERINLRTLQHHGDNALAVIRRFGNLPLQPQPGDAVYADLFGLRVVHWPAGWTLPLALLLVIAVAGAVVVLVARGAMKAREAAWGMLASLLALGGAVAAGAAAGAVLAAVTGRPGVLHAHPEPALAALWLGALAVVLLTAWLFSGFAGFWGLFTGVWLLITVAAAALAAPLPGAAVVLFIPAAVGATCVALAAVAYDREPGRPGLAAAVACMGAAVTLIPLAILVYDAFGLELPMAIAGVTGMVALPLMPLVAAGPRARRAQRTAFAAAAVAAGLSLAVAAVVPGYSEDRPRPLNIVYARDAMAGDARWVIQGLDVSTVSLPPGMKEAAAFTDSVLPGLPPVGRGPVAPAEYVDLPGPLLTVLDERRAEGGGWLVRVRVEAATPGNRVALVLEGSGALRVAGATVRGFRGIVPGATTWVLHGIPAGGTDLLLVLHGDGERGLVLWDFAHGLPDAAEPLLHARPPDAAPFADGDLTVTFHQMVVAR